MSEKRPPPGIVTRADLALSAKNLDVVTRHAQETIANIQEIPTLSRKAAQDLRMFTQWQEQRGGVSAGHRNLWAQHVEALRDELGGVLGELADEAGVHAKMPERQTHLGSAGDLSRSDASFRRRHALRARATQLHQQLDEAADIRFTGGRWSPLTPRRPGIRPVVNGAFPLTGGAAIPGLDMPGGPSMSYGGHQAVGGRLRIPPAAVEWFWGGQGGARGWASRGVGSAMARARKAPAMAGMLSTGYVLNLAGQSIPLAEGYAVDLLNTVAKRDLWERDSDGGPMGVSAGDPWYTHRIPNSYDRQPFKYADKAVIGLRSALERVGQDWMFTTKEALSIVQGLGHEYTEGRLRASAHYSRQTGIDPGQVGRFYGNLLFHVAPMFSTVSVAEHDPDADLPWANIRGDKVGLPPAYPRVFAKGSARRVLDVSLLQDTMRSMRWSDAGTQRPEEFMDDVMALGEAMSSGQGLVDRYDPLGVAAVFTKAGLGGERWRPMMVGMVRGMGGGAGPEDVATAARLGAIRKYMPRFVKIGAGEYETTVDTKSVRGAMQLAKSGHPSVLKAYARYAREKAGGDDEIARDIFGKRLLGGSLGTVQVDLIWEGLGALEGWRDAGKGVGVGEVDEDWREGPAITGTKGKNTYGSVARHRAEKDWTSHKVGRRLLYVTENMKDAVTTAGEAMIAGAGPLEAFQRGASKLKKDSRTILALAALSKGGKDGALQALYWLFGKGSLYPSTTSGAPPRTQPTRPGRKPAPSRPGMPSRQRPSPNVRPTPTTWQGPPAPTPTPATSAAHSHHGHDHTQTLPSMMTARETDQLYGPLPWTPAAGGRIHVDHGWRRKNVQFGRLHTGQGVNFHRDVFDSFKETFESATTVSGYTPRKVGSYVQRRANWDDTSGPSKHAYGLAADVYPHGKEELPAAFIEEMERGGWLWGGHWDVPDPTHFEYGHPTRSGRRK